MSDSIENKSEVSVEEIPTEETPISEWELLNLNNNPDDNYNCFIATAAGMWGFDRVTDFETIARTDQIVRAVIKCNGVDKTVGASIPAIKAFYASIGIRFVKAFLLEDTLWKYLENDVKIGDKKKFALAFRWNVSHRYKPAANSSGAPVCGGHMVVLKVDKTDESKAVYRVIDHQLSACMVHEKKECYKYHYSKYMRLHDSDARLKFFSYAAPTFYLFEKIVYDGIEND